VTTTTTAGDFVSTRRIGDAVISVVSEGTLRWAPRFAQPEAEWRRAVPDADAEGRILLGLNVMHVRLGAASIVIDPGMDGPDSAFQREMEAKWPAMTRTPGLGAAIGHLEIQPADVTHVLITHAHDDHFAGVVAERGGTLTPRFPRARHVLGRADWDGNPKLGDAQSVMAMRLGAVERAGLLDLITGDCDVAPGVTMIQTPGESPGHCAVRVQTGAAWVYYLGDLVHHACEVEHPDWAPGQNRDAAALAESRRRLFAEIAERPALVAFSHAPFPAWGRVQTTAGGCRFVIA
jgi:glyoxylase-like metal-dependent hydrolase (beta-lactamase superfamily II)